jgi:hypothetical protein
MPCTLVTQWSPNTAKAASNTRVTEPVRRTSLMREDTPSQPVTPSYSN